MRNSKYVKIVSKKEGKYAFATLNAYDSNIVTNGNVIYYVSDDHHYFYLNRYDCAKRNIKRLKKLGSSRKIRSEPASWYFRYAYRQYIYLTRSSFDDWNYQTYVFNTRNNALSAMPVALIYRTDVSPYPLKLYKIKSNGRLKTVKTLSPWNAKETH